MQRELALADAREVSASLVKRSIFVAKGSARLRAEPDSSTSYLYSSQFTKLLFGREAIEVFKVQAGVRISQRPRDLRIRLSPAGVDFRSQELIQVTQSLRTFKGATEGFSRIVRVTNKGDSGVRLRLLTHHDPTSLNYRRERDPPGEIGVNAFNRGDHVVMDDVGDTTGVRVMGFSPMPSTIYMSKDRQKSAELLNSGELPDSTAGMSGAILILTEQEFELPPNASAEFGMVSLYHPSSLEVALSEFKQALQGIDRNARTTEREPVMRCSSPSVNFAYSWAVASAQSIEAETDPLERLSSGFALRLLRPAYFEQLFETTKSSQRRDGYIPHSVSSRGGPLETAFFLIEACGYLLTRSDKKLSKKWYPTLKKAGEALRRSSTNGLITTAQDSADGWRRRLGSGFPSGEVSEVNLLVARSLSDLSALAYVLGKGSESGAFKEASVKITAAVNSTLKDAESGTLALNLDAKGRLHKEVTSDQAVALSHNSIDHNLASSVVHRLLEKDFETGYGPRTVPNSNALYYNPTYGEGQLGGFWTRASLAHALLAYSSGYPSIGAAQLEKVARLVYSDCENMGGVPGEFPYWVDPDRRVVGSIGSDPVAASRFIEAVMVGELGLSFTPQGVRLSAPGTSKLKWLFTYNLELGSTGSVFLGRAQAAPLLVSSYLNVAVEGSTTFQGCERLNTPSPIEGLVFWGPASLLVCLGNTGSGDYSGTISAPLRGKPIARSLFADLEEYSLEASKWRKLERKKLSDSLELRVEIRSGSWKAFRLSQITS